MRQIQIREVGPRDGLQNAHQRMSTEPKKAWIRAIAAAGVPEIEVGSSRASRSWRLPRT